MKKKKIISRKLLFILIPILIIILIVVGIIVAVAGNYQKDEGDFLNSFGAEETRVVNCVDLKDEDCLISSISTYKFYQYHYDNPDIEALVDKINEQTRKLQKEEEKKGTVNYKECDEVKDKYKYRYLTTNHLEYFDLKDQALTITVELNTRDYCTGETKYSSEVYVYDKVNGKFIETQDEMFEFFHETPDSVNEVIVRYAKQYEDREIDPAKIVNYRLAYNHNTRFIIQYQLEGDDTWYFAYRAPNKEKETKTETETNQ